MKIRIYKNKYEFFKDIAVAVLNKLATPQRTPFANKGIVKLNTATKAITI
ncbi:hypothetical protein [Flavobacterium sp.]|nr:hypothetical protein [Flavobacterium sp.]MDI1315962.1 hypothetical protein [Flavobacterium sp.]